MDRHSSKGFLKFHTAVTSVILFLTVAISCASRPDKCESYYELKKALFPALISLEYSNNEVDKWVDDKRTAKFLFIGDSIIQGWMILNKDLPGGYNWMSDAILTDTVNTAIVGNTTCDLIARERRHVDSFKPQFIMTDGGGNDFKYGSEDHTIMSNLNIFLTMVRDGNPEARVVYGGIPPTQIPYANLHEIEINEYVRSVVIPKIGNACFITMYDFLSTTGQPGAPIKSEYSLDGIHFEPQVYVEYKNRVEAAFNAVKDTPVPSYLTCTLER